MEKRDSALTAEAFVELAKITSMLAVADTLNVNTVPPAAPATAHDCALVVQLLKIIKTTLTKRRIFYSFIYRMVSSTNERSHVQ